MKTAIGRGQPHDRSLPGETLHSRGLGQLYHERLKKHCTRAVSPSGTSIKRQRDRLMTFVREVTDTFRVIIETRIVELIINDASNSRIDIFNLYTHGN